MVITQAFLENGLSYQLSPVPSLILKLYSVHIYTYIWLTHVPPPLTVLQSYTYPTMRSFLLLFMILSSVLGTPINSTANIIPWTPDIDISAILQYMPFIPSKRYTMIYLHAICVDTEEKCDNIGCYKDRHLVNSFLFLY